VLQKNFRYDTLFIIGGDYVERTTTYVRVSDVGADYKMRYDSILYFFIDSSADIHFKSNKVQTESLPKSPYSFYLLGWQIEILRRPKLNEQIWGESWAHGYEITDNETLSFRSAALYDANNELCAYGIMTVTIVDSTTKSKIVLNEEDIARFDELRITGPQLSFNQLPWAIPFEQAQAQLLPPFPVRKSDIDLYRHVNNGKYVTMALEYLPDGFRPRRIRVQYKHAAKYGDIIHPKITVAGHCCTVSLCSDQDKPYALVQFSDS